MILLFSKTTLITEILFILSSHSGFYVDSNNINMKPESKAENKVEPKVLTTSTGQPIDDNQNSVTAGEYGPIVISDFHLIDKLAHFDRERIPERVVHAKGAGYHGYFKVTHDVSKYTKAKVFESIGKVTPIFTRFSTVAG